MLCIREHDLELCLHDIIPSLVDQEELNEKHTSLDKAILIVVDACRGGFTALRLWLMVSVALCLLQV